MGKYDGIEITDAMAARLHKGLKEFGYPSLPFAAVRKAIDDVLAGTESPTDVISLIVKKQIDEAIEDARP